MSVAFSSARPRSKGEVTQQTIQKMLDENNHLIQCIMDYQSKGKTAECTQYQQILHRNLVYLATIADSNQNMQTLLPAPPATNMSLVSGGMGQSVGHAPSNLNDNMASGHPPTSMMQSQMSNGLSHAPMQQSAIPSASLSQPASSYGSSAPTSGYSHSAPSSQGSIIQGPGSGYGSSSSSSSTPSASSSSSRSNLNLQSNQVSMMQQQSATPHYSSAQAGGQHYQGQQAMGMMGQSSQGNSMMSQRPMGSYRSSQQGPAWQCMGQEEFYGEQYGHTQSSSKPINRQYYPDGHGEYSYQQSSYGEQGYDRSFDESSQHYYEGGNSQYSQQQAQYQQPYSQQQYSSQQGYSGQPQGYGPGQGGSSQYSQYQQGQSQQYSSYRSSQGGPGAQTQRPYTYEQGQYGNYQQ
ncbi:calcium-responsive transactivator-like isoform X4 [Gymnodraco acuticeps]|uniref:Calcium-responsive transactivator-like isoform X4 n=1 Tax=Gymnodraco acuticeps TaxID=8218 RepID=A0A6P8UMA3_GYMAC|nr:calcium-responsive transactivator-like isoform X4 [Gymnodraco acuticeps]